MGTGNGADRPPEGSLSDSVGAAFESVGDEVARLVRAETERLRAELLSHAQDAGRGAAYLAGASALGAASVAALGTLPVLALRRWLPGWAIAGGIAAGAAGGAAALSSRALDELRRAAPESVERRLDAAMTGLVEDVRARLRAMASGRPGGASPADGGGGP